MRRLVWQVAGAAAGVALGVLLAAARAGLGALPAAGWTARAVRQGASRLRSQQGPRLRTPVVAVTSNAPSARGAVLATRRCKSRPGKAGDSRGRPAGSARMSAS